MKPSPALGIALLALATLGSSCSTTKHTNQARGGVEILPLPDRVQVKLDGQLFTEYFFTNVPRPYFYPVNGPEQLPLTRNWPMQSVAGESKDHPHHRSLWYAHGDVNGVDFWSEEKNYGHIVHDGFTEMSSGRKAGVIRSRDKWVAPDGKVVCTDERSLRVYAPASSREKIFDFEVTLIASNGEVTFRDTKEGTMAMRVAETMRLHGPVGHGHIINSEGVQDDATWGKRAAWCDYSGPVENKMVGVAIFDHPDNPRHPTWWHVRDYGLFAANPFGQSYFENLKDKTAGNFVLHKGQRATFRYRFYLHLGDEKEAQVAKRYADYAQTPGK